MTLHEGRIGGWYQVEDIRLAEDVSRRLQVLGLTIGTKVEVLNRKGGRGAIIFKVRGTRFAIGGKIADGILVKEVQ